MSLFCFWTVLSTISVWATQSVTFGWDPSADPNVVGYNIYYGTDSHVYTNKISVGNVTSATISGLVEGATYYFAGTTYDSLNQESSLSDELSYTVPMDITPAPPTLTGLVATNAAVAGQNLTFSITATGTGPLTYQWQYNSNNLAAATNAVLALSAVSVAQSGVYTVIVSNSVGVASSVVANLTVVPSTVATLTTVSRVNGQFALNIAGLPGAQYVVQASTNLVNWVSLQTNAAPFNFVDPNTSQFSQRFYRTYLAGSMPINSVSDITDGLVVYYPLASNGNDSWAGNNLTLLGSPTFASSAVHWNGAVPTMGYSAAQQWPQTGLTVSAWINMDDPNANYIVASCYGDATSSLKAEYMQFFASGSGLTARVVQNIDTDFIGRSTAARLTSGWHLVAFTWSGSAASSSIKIYLDGTQIDNADSSGGNFTAAYSGSDVPLSVGAQFSDGYGISGKFFGSEKGVRLYRRALSATEIGALYSGGITGGTY